MAELTSPDDASSDEAPSDSSPACSPATELALRARIAELEALLDARTQTVVAMGAHLAELRGDEPPSLAQRLRDVEAQFAQLSSTKVLRYSELPRKVYRVVRGRGRG